MKCLNIKKLISLQNNLLNDSEMQEINDHLLSCDKCKKKHETYKKYRDFFKRNLKLSTSSEKTECFDEFELVSYLEGGVERNVRSKYYLHLSQCQSCLDNLLSLENLLHDLKSEGLLSSEKSYREKANRFITTIAQTTKDKLKSIRDLFVLPLPAYRRAGMVIILLAAIFFLLPEQNQNNTPFTTRDQNKFETGIQLLFPLNQISINESSPEFRWEKVPEASKYTILLLDANGDIVWEKQTSLSKLKLPQEIKLLPTMTYFWQVEAFFKDGSSMVSGMSGFTITQ